VITGTDVIVASYQPA